MLKSHGAGVYSSDAKGHTLLDSAVIYGSVEVAEWLLEEVGVHGDMSGKGNPLHVAALNGNARMVRMLLAKGRWGANERDAKNAMTPALFGGQVASGAPVGSRAAREIADRAEDAGPTGEHARRLRSSGCGKGTLGGGSGLAT
jgi:ankyrin repeat protein